MLQRGMASWKRMLEVLDTRRRSADATGDRAAGRDAAPRRRRPIEFRDLTFSYPASDRPSSTTSRPRIEPGRRWRSSARTGSGKSTLISLLRAPARSAAGHGLHRRRRRPRPPAAVACAARSASCRRSRSCSRTRSPTTSRSGQMRSRSCDGQTAAGGHAIGSSESKRRRRSRGSTRTSPTFRRATTRWSASAASRCRAARSSAPRSRARWSIDPAILILDDALSAVDTYTEEEILSRLRGVMRERTSIIVSHRISTVRDADQIFVLDDGRIVERGTHDELVAARRALRRDCTEAAAGRGARRPSSLAGRMSATTKKSSARPTTRA